MKKDNIKIFVLFIIVFIIIQKMEGQVNNDFRAMIEAATKAPSGHNTQPWLFKIHKSQIEILPNWQDTLPVVDKNNRELFISLGAATENLCIMASHLGYASSVKIEQAEKKIVIDLVRQHDVQKNDLVLQIDERQTNRKVYDGKTIPSDILQILNNLKLYNNTSYYTIGKSDTLYSVLKEFIRRGNDIQMNNDAFKEELLKYMRFNNREIKQNPTGLTFKVIGAPALPAVISKPVVKSFLKAEKQNKSDIEKVDSSSNLVLFTTKKDTFEDWINLGRSLEKYLLKVTELHLAYAFMNQPCEEEDLAEELQNYISLIKGEYPTLLLRIGYADKAPYSPRKNIDDVIVK